MVRGGGAPRAPTTAPLRATVDTPTGPDTTTGQGSDEVTDTTNRVEQRHDRTERMNDRAERTNTGRHTDSGGRQDSGERQGSGTVRRLPVPVGEVLEGELVSEREYRRLTSQRALAVGRWRGYRSDVVAVARTVRTVAGHDRTRAVVRHALAYPVSGAGVVIRRWRDTHGPNRYERQMRAAEAAGDQDALRYWQEADVTEKAATPG